jgi:L-asparaginase II
VPSPAPLLSIVRSGLEESVHVGHVAVCDTDGRLVAAAGDPARPAFLRSSLKPLQAAVSLRAIGEPLPDAPLAVMCGSHDGTPVHVRVVRGLLRRAGMVEDDLRCPPGRPLAAGVAARTPRRIVHNCSGKHAGMLLASAKAGWDPMTYPDVSHPLQRRVTRAVAEAASNRPARVGVDGCGVPVFAFPIRGVAAIFARLGRPERLSLAAEVARCTDAMRARPDLVAGSGRADTLLMETVPGLIAKEGAEGLACAAVPEVGLGVAVKALDGAERAAAAGLVTVLGELGLLTPGQRTALARLERPVVLGGDREVGRGVPSLRLRRR